MPRWARRSMFGVFTCGWPRRQPTQSLRSSMAMKRTLGLGGGSTAKSGAAISKKASVNIPIVRSRLFGRCRWWAVGGCAALSHPTVRPAEVLVEESEGALTVDAVAALEEFDLGAVGKAKLSVEETDFGVFVGD